MFILIYCRLFLLFNYLNPDWLYSITMKSMIIHVIYECSDGNLRGNCVCLKSKIQYSKCTNVFLIDHHDCDAFCSYFLCICGYRKITWISRDLENKTIDLPSSNLRLMFTSRLTLSFSLRFTLKDDLLEIHLLSSLVYSPRDFHINWRLL